MRPSNHRVHCVTPRVHDLIAKPLAATLLTPALIGFNHTERMGEHALGHGMEIARRLRNHDLMPIMGWCSQGGGKRLLYH